MKLQALNIVALLVALVLAMVGATFKQELDLAQGEVVMAPEAAPGATEVVDARGQTIPVRDYQRIVSLNSVADPILLELVAPDRLLAVTGYTVGQHPEGYRFAGRTAVARSSDLETILSLKPDLIITSQFAEEPFMARLRERGIPVFDPGEMRGVDTTVHTIRVLGQLLGRTEQADRIEADYRLRLAALRNAVPDAERVPAVYFTIYGDLLYGGTTGSSYGDVLHYAGILDLAAANGYRDWPQYSPEQLLELDPSLVITQSGMAAVICGHSTLRELPSCQAGGRMVEVSAEYLSDAGLGIVHGALQVQALVYPDHLDRILHPPSPEGPDVSQP
jgi:iron complex transport system substrate-binding protein